MNFTLYDLAAEMRHVADTLADMDLPAEVVADTLESVAMPFEQKAEAVAAVAKTYDAQADAIEAAARAMAERAKAKRTRAASLRDYLLANMQRAGISKIECPWFRIAVRQNPEAVVIDDESAIPADYRREIPAKHEPDKALIKSALQDGYSVPGVHLARATRLEIR